MTNPTAPEMTRERLEVWRDMLLKTFAGKYKPEKERNTREINTFCDLALRAEENERDGARLEFMVTHPEYRIVKSRNSSEWSAMDCSNGLTFIGRGYKSMRDAIDAAISALDSGGGRK